MPELASSHYLQSAEWASLRPDTGWNVRRIILPEQRVVHAYYKPTPLGSIVYIPGFAPRSPEDLSKVAAKAKAGRNLVCKIETCGPADKEMESWFEDAGWRRAHNIQYRHTVVLDLAQKENDLWMGMKARGRQEINYARKAGVVIKAVRTSDKNFEIMYGLLQDTSSRKAFGIRDRESTFKYWRAFSGNGHLRLYFAYAGNRVIAGGVFVTDGRERAWYKDAGSLPAYAKMFGPRLLLWEAALALKKEGHTSLDLGGVPSPASYQQSPMRGIYVFKSAYNREVTTLAPAYELPIRPLLYPMWQRLEKPLLQLKRTLHRLHG